MKIRRYTEEKYNFTFLSPVWWHSWTEAAPHLRLQELLVPGQSSRGHRGQVVGGVQAPGESTILCDFIHRELTNWNLFRWIIRMGGSRYLNVKLVCMVEVKDNNRDQQRL